MFLFGTRATTLVAALALMLGGASIAEAVVIVDPDAFPEGTNITNAFANVTLRAIGVGWDSPLAPDIFSVDPTTESYGDYPFEASTGSLAFGHQCRANFPHLFREVGLCHLRVDFAVLANFVSVDFIGNDSSDYGVLQAYDSVGNPLGAWKKTPQLGINQVGTLTWSSGYNNIAYIIAAGDSSQSALGIDNLQYIPEPATICLLGLGALSLLRSRKRKTQGKDNESLLIKI
jgi:hypothetical protein